MFLFFKHKTAYEMRISDWSSDVCSSDLSDNPSTRMVSLLTVALLRRVAICSRLLRTLPVSARSCLIGLTPRTADWKREKSSSCMGPPNRMAVYPSHSAWRTSFHPGVLFLASCRECLERLPGIGRAHI